jgi:hypothetical protein
VRFKGELDTGEEGPGEADDKDEVLSLLFGAFGDLDLPSPDFVLDRFYSFSTYAERGTDGL